MTVNNTSASYLDLLLSIGRDGQLRTSLNDKRDDSTSISQTFRSWVAILHLRQPMAILSHSPYGMPELAPLMNVLFWGRRDFHLSSPDRDMSGNVLWSIWGYHQTLWSLLLPIVTWRSGTWPYTVTDQTLHQFVNGKGEGERQIFVQHV